ncbi:hypothetical protein D9M68_852270 [compost metagenome]
MRSGRCIDQLPDNAHAIVQLAHTALEHIAHAELAPDLFHIHGPALVGKAGVTRNHEEPIDARQASDNVIDYAVDEVFLRLAATQIRERQDGDRRFLGHRQGRRWRCLAHARVAARHRRAYIAIAAARQRLDPGATVALLQYAAQRRNLHGEVAVLDHKAWPRRFDQRSLADR